ncbi:MAG: S9 family peptidase [Erysipelothrix sp.]|nr:S9 family peptidase [Erysipelothrix sp.]
MKPETFSTFTFLSSLKANPSFTQVAYVKSGVNLEEDKYESVIMLYNEHGHKQMTYLKKESNVSWKDDHTLIFQSKRDEKASPFTSIIYALPLSGGEAYELLKVDLPISSPTFLNDGSCVALATYHLDHPNLHAYSKKQRDHVEKTNKEHDFVQIIKEVPFYTNGGTFIDQLRQRLVHISADGKTITPLTSMTLSVSSFEVTHDESKVIFMASPIKGVRPLHSFMYEVSLKEPKVRQLSKAKVGLGGFELFNDTILAYVSDRKQFGLNQNMVVCELKDGEFNQIYDPFYNIGNSINSDARLAGSSSMGVFKDTLVLNVTVEDHSRLIFLDKNYKVVKEVDVQGSCDGLTMLHDEFVMIAMINQNLQELTTLQGTPLTSYNSDVFKDLTISVPQSLKVHHHDRITEGWVLTPPHFDSKKTYPAICVIHGGPKTVYSFVYTHEMQLWANEGYVVMYCNPVGGDGRGNKFADIRGHYGSQDMEDIMSFVDEVLHHYPNIDEQRLGLTGGSYGGYMTNWITSHTHRFKAAVTQRSICNWTSFYGVSDIGHYFVKDQVAADLHQPLDHDALWNNSPLKYVTNVKTPTLVVHSKLDYRCPIDQGYQWFSSLKLLGVPTKMVMFHNENHDLTRSGKPKARLESYKEILNWFNTYLKDK